jgi:hypothetical protein
MRRVGFEPTIPVFERAKTVHALERATTVTGTNKIQANEIWQALRQKQFTKASAAQVHWDDESRLNSISLLLSTARPELLLNVNSKCRVIPREKNFKGINEGNINLLVQH